MKIRHDNNNNKKIKPFLENLGSDFTVAGF